MDCDVHVTSGQPDDDVTPAEERCPPLPIGQVRQELREYAATITRVDNALGTLRHELMKLREQDLFLLKQLIQVGDNIRKLSRSRHGAKRKAQRASKELMTTAADLSVTLRRFRGRSDSLFAGDSGSVPLIRRQSEPQVCLLGPPCDVRSWDSRRGSGSSADWWGSEDALESSIDELDTFGSDDDVLNASTVSCFTAIDATPIPAATSSNIKTNDNNNDENTTTTTPLANNTTTTTTLDVPNYSATTLPNLKSRRRRPEPEDGDPPTTPKSDIWHRPKSHSVVASTFLSSSSGGGSGLLGAARNSAYSDILTNNVNLWKNRLQNAPSVRQKVAIFEEEESSQ